MKDNGLIIICMEMAVTLERMEGNMKGNISLIKSMVMESIFGLTVDYFYFYCNN